jgi:hypothetical protein
LPVQILNHQRRRRLVARILEIVCVFDQVEDDKHARTRRLGYGFRSDWVMWLGEKREPVRLAKWCRKTVSEGSGIMLMEDD